MEDIQTLAALQEALIKARIKFTTGTAAQWATANPVLLDGEVGVVKGASPAQFKIGDGTKTWSQLGWANQTQLSQLADDATHRTVTDAEKAAWNAKAEKTAATTAADGLMSKSDKAKLDGVAAGANNYVHPASHPASMITPDATHRFVSDTQIARWDGKGRVFNFDYGAYVATNTSAAQKQIARDIFASVMHNDNDVVIAHSVEVPGTNPAVVVDGLVTFPLKRAGEVIGIVQDFVETSIEGGKKVVLATVKITIKSDGTVTLEKIDRSKELVTVDGLPTYTLEKVATEAGFASTYHFKENGRKIGASINIPLDQVLRGSSIKSVTTAGSPYAGAKVGDKYIEFLFQNNSTPQYLPVQDLVDVYKGDNTYIQVSASNVIQLNYAALKTKLQSDFGSVFDAKGAGAAAAKAAVDEFKASSFVIQCTIPGMN